MIVCGFLLLWSPSRPTRHRRAVHVGPQLRKCLQQTRAAKRALHKNNYGEAKLRIQSVEAMLGSLLKQDESAQP